MRKISVVLWITSAVAVGTLASLVACEFLNDTTGSWPMVTISSGNIIGRNFTSQWTNTFMYAFQGIPYAAPPVGTSRFKPPQPPANWTYLSYKNCTEDGPMCYQPSSNYFNGSSVMSEDCLILNVFTGSLMGSMPVLVWIHGGAFKGGYGGYSAGAPDMLVSEGVVVVTINYRLGALGFLTLGTSEAPGNAGFHDQILALKWVQNNIKQFGGDPTKVTIWGQSAGSISVHLLYLSPLAKGLFRSAIADSGTALMNAVWSDGSSYGFQLAQLLNCSGATSLNASSALSCLQTVPADDLISLQSNVSVSYEDNVNGNWLTWRGNVDKGLASEPFLPALPEALWLHAQGSQVPIIMGNVADEGVVRIPDSEDVVMNITNNLMYFIPEDVRSQLTKAKMAVYTQNIRDFYFPNNTTASSSNISGLVSLYGDFLFKYGTSVSARMYKRKQSDVYLYFFNFNGTYKDTSETELDKKYNRSFISHGMELQYLFVPQSLTALPSDDDLDLITWKRMVRLWTNFVKTGAPTSALENDTLLQNISWNPAGSGENTYYLNISSNLTMHTDAYLKDIVALWQPILGGVPTSSSTSMSVTGSLLVLMVALLNL